jgi:hypothetical protein
VREQADAYAALVVGNLILRLYYLRLHVLIIGFERVQIVADDAKLGLGLLQFVPEGHGSSRNNG